MKMDNNMNNDINNNVDDSVINFSEYINPENELSEEMLQAYLDATDMETPDLWNRIDEGYALELQQIKQNEIKERKKRNKKLITVLAVAGVLLVIGTPVLFFGMGNVRDLTGDKSMNDESEIAMDEAVDEEVQMESAVADENEMAMDEAPMEETPTEAISTEASVEETPTDDVPEQIGNQNGTGDSTTESAAIVMTNSFVYNDGSYVLYIESVVDIGENDYGMKSGDYVVAVNTEEIDALLQKLGIYEESNSYHDYGELVVSMNILDYYDGDEENISHKVIVTNVELKE